MFFVHLDKPSFILYLSYKIVKIGASLSFLAHIIFLESLPMYRNRKISLAFPVNFTQVVIKQVF